MSRPVTPPASQPGGPQSADDVAIGIALTTTWMLATGRRLRCDVPLFHDLPGPQLIDFWADDHIEPAAETLSVVTEQASNDPQPAGVRRPV